ncbi:MAG TPA: 3'-5' exonuclease [Azospira sp.]|nr:3'-5' exonuclease [Azospira sp.]HNN07527.1 3'-5' exonuclease [Azospira sp.]HNN46577.1 3'-5' exonuclease [Azospira sp.]
MKWLKDLFGKASSAVPLTAAQEEALAAWQKRPAEDMSRSHFRTRYIVVDVESSGLNMVRDSLISIGAVAVCEGVIDANDAFEVVLRQDQVSSHENILIHGIGGSAQREGVEPADALLAFLDYVGRAPLVAYHAEFDQAMIGRALREFLGKELDLPWIDLAWVMPELFRELIDGQVVLDEWLQRFDIENILRHNAVSDAYATAKLLLIAQARAVTQGKDSAAVFMDIERARRWVRRGT